MTTHNKKETLVDLSASPYDEVVVADDSAVDESEAVVIDQRDGGKLPEGTKLNADGTVTVTLSETITIPVTKNGVVEKKEYSVLTCRRLRGKDQKGLRGFDDEQRGNRGIAVMCDIHPAIMEKLMDEMITYDQDRLAKVFIYFLQNGPKKPFF